MIRGHRSHRDAFVEKLLPVETSSVIGNSNHDAPSRMKRRQQEIPRGRLLRGLTFTRQLDAMVNGIPDQVDQRFIYNVHHAAIDLRVLVIECQNDFLSQFVRQVAHQARHSLEGGSKRHHPIAMLRS